MQYQDSQTAAPDSNTVLILIAKFRASAQRAIRNFGIRIDTGQSDRAPYILVSPEDLLLMIGENGSEREKLIIVNAENEKRRVQLEMISQLTTGIPIFDDCLTPLEQMSRAIEYGRNTANLEQQLRNERHEKYHLASRLSRLLFQTTNSHGADYILHAQLTKILKEFPTEYGAAAPANNE